MKVERSCVQSLWTGGEKVVSHADMPDIPRRPTSWSDVEGRALKRVCVLKKQTGGRAKKASLRLRGP